MNVKVRLESPDRLKEPQFRVYLNACDAFAKAGGPPGAPSAVSVDDAGRLHTVMFYKDAGGQKMLARVTVGADGALEPVEWL